MSRVQESVYDTQGTLPPWQPWQRAALAGSPLPTPGVSQPDRAVPTIREPTGTCSDIRTGFASERSQPEHLNRIFKTGL